MTLAISDPTSTAIDELINRAMALGGTPGMAVSVVRGSDVIYAKGFGFAEVETRRAVDANTLFYIASTTKSFTALTAALLARRGSLDLDAPINRYLPAIALSPPLSAEKITVRDLLSMTHGISGDGPITFRTAFSGQFTDSLLIQLIRLHTPLETGRKFVYSNLGYNVFGLILDSQFKEGWKCVLEHEVFQPLGMSDTTAVLSKVPAKRLAMPYEMGAKGEFERIRYAKKDNNMHAAGGHVSSATDLGRYLIVHLNKGRINGKQVVSESAIVETHRQETEQDRTFGPYHRTGWALGWDIGTYNGETLYHRFGSFPGFRSHVSFMPEHALGVVVLVNGGDAASPFSDLIATSIYDLLLERPQADQEFEQRLEEYQKRLAGAKIAIARDSETRRKRSQQTLLPLSSYAGTYESIALGRMVWTVRNGHLHVDIGSASCDAEVYDASKHEFRVELTGGGEVITFGVPSGNSKPARLLYSGYTFERL